MVGAGILFDIAQEWSFFKRIPQAIMLLPALLGLKGNVEMTLASRLSTQARHKQGGNSGNITTTLLQYLLFEMRFG